MSVSSPEFTPTPVSSLAVGDRIRVDHPTNGSKGLIRYIGGVSAAKDPQAIMLGVEWDDVIGKNNGTVGGKQYFVCSDNQGSFIHPQRASKGYDILTAIRQKYEDYQVGSLKQEMYLVAENNKHNTKRVEVEFKGEDYMFEKIKKQLHRIQHINLMDNQIQYAVPLEHITDQTDPLYAQKLESMNSLREKVPNVASLDLTNNLFYNWHSIISLCQTLPQLQAINISSNHIHSWKKISVTSNTSASDLFALSNELSTTDIQSLSQLHIFIAHSVPNIFERVLLLAAHGAFTSLKELSLQKNQLSNLSATTEKVYRFVEKKSETDDIEASQLKQFMNKCFPALTILNLSENSLSDYEKDVCLFSELPKLEKLLLNDNKLHTITYPAINSSSSSASASSSPSTSSPSSNPSVPFSSLIALSLSNNALSSLDCLSSLERYPALTELRVQHNVALENLFDSVSQTSNGSVSGVGNLQKANALRLIIIAALPRIVTLNLSIITPREKLNAEKFYISHAFFSWRNQQKTTAETPLTTEQLAASWNEINKLFPKYKHFIDQYGDPALIENNEQKSTDSDGTSLKERLVNLHLVLANETANNNTPATTASASSSSTSSSSTVTPLAFPGMTIVSSQSKKLSTTTTITVVRTLLEKSFRVLPLHRNKYNLFYYTPDGQANLLDDNMKQLIYYNVVNEGYLVLCKKL